MNINGKSFIQNYLNDAINIQRIKKGRDLTPEEIDRLKIVLNDRLSNRVSRDFVVTNNYTNEKCIVDNLALANQLSAGKMVMTGYGCLYKHHEDAKNLPALLLDDLVKERDVVKSKEHTHANDADQSVRNYYNRVQKVIKVLANSW